MSSWIFESLIASSLLMGLVLILRRPVTAQFGPRLGYWLWLLPALRMIMPPLPAGSIAPPAERLPDAVSTLPIDVNIIAPTVTDIAVNWGVIIVAVWALGALAHLTLHVWAYHRFARRVSAQAQLLQEIDPGAIQVLASEEVSGPLAMGWVRPAILVPMDFEWRYDLQEREFAIAHEVAHHRRGDLKVNLGALVILSLHWFNPLAHAAYRAFRTDQELACDATIMADAGNDDRHAYGRALVKSACDRAPLVTCALNRKQELKRRLRLMRFGQPSALRSAMGRVMALMLLASGLMLTASVGANAAADTKVGRLVQDAIWEGAAATVSPVSDPVGSDPVVSDPNEATAQSERIAAEAEAKADQAERSAGQAEWTATEIETKIGQQSQNGPSAPAQAIAARADADQARQDAEQARQDANEVRQDALEARREAEETAREAAEEASQAAIEAKQEAEEAVRDAYVAAQQAHAKARVARREAERELQRANRARSQPRWIWRGRNGPVPPTPPTPPVPPVPPVPPTPPSAVLKINTQHINRTVLSALKSARVQISAQINLTDDQKHRALRSLDVEIAHLERQRGH